jgi:rhodanese-related sulfurtransferase/glyoxylase-like metal-dependent hydrolase (beta-lactamase superfamily II)
MYFQQFYLTCLSHASYMIGSEGVAAVIDPQRDVGIYLEAAREQGLAIKHIIETHLHRDFVSGHIELAALTGAGIHLSAKGGAKFPHQPVHDGSEIAFGRCRLRFLETPGHSLDSISILVTDLDRSPEPYAVITGDTLFIGDVGRPDLSPDYTPQQLAALLYRSLHEKLLKLPDNVEVYPAHGAGSLCGRQLSTERFSTIGKERVANYALQARTEQEFVRLVTADQPERPAYFAQDAEINRAGAPLLQELPPLPPLRPGDVIALQEKGAVVLDTRPANQFAAAHIPGAVHIALAGQFASWAGILLGLDARVVLVTEDQPRVAEARVRLARVGLEQVAGYLQDGMAAWIREELPVAQVPAISVQELGRVLAEQPGSLQLIDVRRATEWEDGHIPGALLKPLDKLAALAADLDRTHPVAVHCKSGYRSSIAASLLQREGFQHVYNLTGGFDAWKSSGSPCMHPEPAGAKESQS